MHSRLRKHGQSAAAALLLALPALADPPAPPPEPKPGDEPSVTLPSARRPPRRGEGLELPELSETARKRATASYLTAEEGRALRAFHGIATAEDLGDIPTRAKVALWRGAFDDPALSDASADLLDRAEALLERGQPSEAISLLGELKAPAPPRAIRVRVDALEQLGRVDEAIKAAEALGAELAAGKLQTPPEIVEGVRAVASLTRLKGSQDEPGSDHKALMSILGRVRNQMDPMYWPAILEEARLLLEKDNPEQAAKAIEQALSLNPGCAQALAILGQMSVNSFAFEQGEQIAKVIDRLATMPGDGAPPAPLPPPVAASPLSATIRARAMLRQDDPDGAEAALAQALSRFPARRDLLESQVAAQALRYDPAATEQLIAAYERLVPGSPRALFAAGKALSEARQYGPAAEFLARAAGRAPHWALVAIEQGLLEMQSGRDEQALTALERAAALDPFNVRAGNSLKLIREVIGYARVQSEHFIVRARPGIDAMLASEMLSSLEENYAIVTGPAPGQIDYKPKARTLIDLMPDHQWFAVRIAGLPAIHTIAASTGPIIAMETPRDGPRHSGTYDWQRVVRHEYAHTVGLERTGNRVPHWFTEAQAVFLENSPRAYNTVQLLTNALLHDALFDFVKINIAFTRPEKPTDRPQAYAQGHWMYQYMVETYGGRKVLDLMDRFAAGTREEQAFREVFGVGRDEFMTAFKVWARAQLIAWGMLPPEGTPTVEELLKQEAAAGGASAPDAPKIDAAPEPPEITQSLIDKWLAKYPAHPDVLELAVTKALERTNGVVTEETAPLLERYAAARPVDPMPHRHLARLALDSAEPARAIPHLEYMDAREEHIPTWASNLATLYAQAGDLERAAAKAERATRIAPYVATLRELAATLALQRKDPATAKRHIEFLVALEPDRPIHKQRLEAVRKMLP